MALRDLGPWLLTNPGFKTKFELLTADAVCAEIGPNLSRLEHLTGLKHDWRYLLFAASVLCVSTDGDCQAAALRIAQSCLSSDDLSAERKNSAALILDSLANLPAIKLAVSRQFLLPHFEQRLPIPARIEWTRRLIENSILLRDDSFLSVNRFQKKFWEAMDSHEKVSVSAPTSAGKSFIMSRWIREFVKAHPTATIVYLVPTRALISEIEKSLSVMFEQERGAPAGASVSSLPVSDSISPNQATILVFTQERLHLLLTASPQLSIDLLIVDEAHKVGDLQRGVLLQSVIERSVQINPNGVVIFASPMTGNPEVLISDFGATAESAAFASNDVTVNQNLIWVSQVPRQPVRWAASVCLQDQVVNLGLISLKNIPTPDTKRLPFVAHAIGGLQSGNIIYVNGAGAAEKTATQLFDLLGAEGEIQNSELDELVDLARKIVHAEFLLPKVLKRGIAFHYGNLPLLIREEVERLFSLGVIKYLICTSTLIEGVNMSCRNIFLRGPKKGVGNPMSAEDFWNLAGRAGRWGKEFQGNIICVDAARSDIWGAEGPPKQRVRAQIKRTTDYVMAEPASLIKFITEGAPRGTSKLRPEIEYVFSYLMAEFLRAGSVSKCVWASRYDGAELSALDSALEGAAKTIKTPQSIVERNPGISPFAMDALLGEFSERSSRVEELLPAPPASDDAVTIYTRIFSLLSRHTSPKLGPEGPRAFSLAILVTRWMRGFPLSRLIVDRLGRPHTQSTASIIRSVMEDVEQIARFEAPKGLNCYSDLLRFHLTSAGRSDLVQQIPNLSLLLEFGVSQQTQLALIGCGLSRTSAIALSEIIAADDLTEEGILEWLRLNNQLWRQSDLPALVKKEIRTTILAEDGI